MSALCGAFLIVVFAVGCGDPEPSPEPPPPPPPPVTAPEKLAEHVLTTGRRFGKKGGIYVDERFWVDERRSRRTTVRAKLLELGASLRDGKVVDANGKELYFFYVQNCSRRPGGWKEYEEMLQELKETEKKYHVVRMYPHKPSYD
jgi:hypothetical protein